MIDILHQENFHSSFIWRDRRPRDLQGHEKRVPLLAGRLAGFRYYDVYNPAANDLYCNTEQRPFSKA